MGALIERKFEGEGDVEMVNLLPFKLLPKLTSATGQESSFKV